MKKLLFLLTPVLTFFSLSGCSASCKHEYRLLVTQDADWQTYIVGDDFNEEGLEVSLYCPICRNRKIVEEYTLEDNENLVLGQESIVINYDNYSLDYRITVKEKYHLACLGDSLTAGHYWANQAYPVYLAEKVNERYEVGSFSYNGLSVTGYGGSFDNPNQRYIVRDEYKQSLKFEPDIIAILLGTNDATGWAKAEPTFEDEYRILLDSYIEAFPNVKFIMMVSPPTMTPNSFGIPNDIIRDYVNPIQRDLAEEYGFEILDLREEFEDHDNYETDYLRPNDGVHFTVTAADYVAGRVWDIAKEFTF